MTNEELMYASQEDQEFYLKCVEGLPMINGFSMDGKDSNGEPMCYGTGAHSVRCLREIVEIVKPNHILEIGFNCGYSASMWLNLTLATLTSIDISNRAETLKAAEILAARCPASFRFILSDSGAKNLSWEIRDRRYDLIFIDGGHEEHHVVIDIALALSLGIKYLAFDDVLPQFGPGVLPGIAHFPQLQEVKTMGNIGLYLNTSVA